MTPEQRKSVVYLRNIGSSHESVCTLTRKKDPAVKRVFRQLAELGVPHSMAAELTGLTLDAWHTSTDLHRMRLQTLWTLTEAYWDVARRVPGALEGLDEVVLEAQACGVYYDPPACTRSVVEYHSAKRQGRKPFDLDRPFNPFLTDDSMMVMGPGQKRKRFSKKDPELLAQAVAALETGVSFDRASEMTGIPSRTLQTWKSIGVIKTTESMRKVQNRRDPETIARVQACLDEGMNYADTARANGLNPDTLRRWVFDGVVTRPGHKARRNNPTSIYTEKKVEQVRELLTQGKSYKQVEEATGISHYTIESWVRKGVIERGGKHTGGRPVKYDIDYGAMAQVYLAGGSLATEARKVGMSRQQMFVGVKRWLSRQSEGSSAAGGPPTPLEAEGTARGLPQIGRAHV